MSANRKKNPVILIHGYSDQGKSFTRWREILRQSGYTDVKDISICSYESLTNEVTIKDIAEGFNRALRINANIGPDDPFDAIVHSTGMLVIRSWLTTYTDRQRRGRLKRLIGLSPATFGSPLAHEGRSLLGAIFKGNKKDFLGPDFLEAGDKVLDGLELGSRFTWELAHLDLLPYDELDNPFPSDKTPGSSFYGSDDSTPYVFIFCGTAAYGGLRKLVNQPGTDGTVRWAGCSLHTRKISLDLTEGRKGSDAGGSGQPVLKVLSGTNIPIPLMPVSGLNHGEMLSDPTADLIEMVVQALGVSGWDDFNKWHADWEQTRLRGYEELADPDTKGSGNWAQFIVHAVDERNDPIKDFHLQLFKEDENNEGDLIDIEMDTYAYSGDSSFVCYHIDLNQLGQIEVGQDLPDALLARIHVRVIASSGSQLVTYYGRGSEKNVADPEKTTDGVWDAVLDFSSLETTDEAAHFFRPFTTTLIELRLNREPLPLDAAQKNKVCYWEDFE